MLEKFLSQTTFTSQDDFVKNFHIKVPESFNFGYDVVDAWAAQAPDKIALCWTNDLGVHHDFTFAELKDYKGEFALQSFDPRILRQIKKQAPHILRGQLACKNSGQKSAFSRWVVRFMPMNFLNKPHFISYCSADLPYRRAKRRGALLLCWTVRDEDEYLRVKPLVDNVIFENIRPEQLYVTCGQHR